MDTYEFKSKVYIKTDDFNRVVRCEGQYTLPKDLTEWILIEEGNSCDRLNLAQSHYFEGGLRTFDGIPRYKWDGEQAVLRTEVEIEVDRAEISEPEVILTQDELQWQAITDLEISQMEYDQALTDLEIAYLEGSAKA